MGRQICYKCYCYFCYSYYSCGCRTDGRVHPPFKKSCQPRTRTNQMFKSFLHSPVNIHLERKWVREERLIGCNVSKRKPYSSFHVTAYDSFLPDPFSLLENMDYLLENIQQETSFALLL